MRFIFGIRSGLWSQATKDGTIDSSDQDTYFSQNSNFNGLMPTPYDPLNKFEGFERPIREFD